MQQTEDRWATCGDKVWTHHHDDPTHLVRSALVCPDQLRGLTQPQQVTLGCQLQALGLRPLLQEAQSVTSDSVR